MTVLSAAAALTKSRKDDQRVEFAQKVADLFIVPGGNGSEQVRNASAVMLKEMLLDPDFLRKSGLTELQASQTLYAALAYLKPESVDTPEEIQALLDDTARAFCKV